MNRVANELLKIKAVFLRPDQPFIWASGIKSPIYTDNRLVISHPQSRNIIENALAKLIKQKYPKVGVICGTATAGIPHAAYVSHLLKLPMIYVRNKAKTHGRAKAIEGEIKPNTPVVVIEDLLSTGNSCLEVVKILRRYKVKVLGVASIFSYGMLSCTNNFQQHQCPVYALSTLDDLLPEAIKKKYITKQQAEQIVQFRDHPNDTGWIK